MRIQKRGSPSAFDGFSVDCSGHPDGQRLPHNLLHGSDHPGRLSSWNSSRPYRYVLAYTKAAREGWDKAGDSKRSKSCKASCPTMPHREVATLSRDRDTSEAGAHVIRIILSEWFDRG